MKTKNLEIVIAAYNEKTDWLPESWVPITTVYTCGEPEFDPIIPPKKNVHKPNRHMHMLHGEFYRELDKVEAILDLALKISNKFNHSLTEKSHSSNYGLTRRKITQNCNNLRESEQWINHIVWRYDYLAEHTVFLQGDPFDHAPWIIDEVEAYEGVPFQTFPKNFPGPASASSDLELLLPFYNKWFEENCTKSDPPIVCWSPGAQFAASAETIRSRPLEYYINLQNTLRGVSRSGEILERIWWNILGCPKC